MNKLMNFFQNFHSRPKRSQEIYKEGCVQFYQTPCNTLLPSSAVASTPTSVKAEVSFILTLHQISSGAFQISSGATQISSDTTQISSGATQLSSGAAGKVLKLILMNSTYLVWLYALSYDQKQDS